MKPVITLTTDLGDHSMYVAVVKGKILQANPEANIIDISHQIRPQNFVEAAFVLKNTFSHFPKGSIHIIEVNSFGAMETSSGEKMRYKFLAIEYKEHFFIGADSGIFSLLFDEPPTKIIEMNAEKYNPQSTFPIADIFVNVACRLANENKLDVLGNVVNEIYRLPVLQPVINESNIRATVIYIDRFENVFVNLKKDLFEKVAKGRKAVVSIRGERMDEISSSYFDAAKSYPVCFFNSFGYLEIAINNGNAKGLLGLKMSDTVIIEFE